MEATRDVESGAERALDRVGFSVNGAALYGTNVPLPRASPTLPRLQNQARLESRRLLSLTDAGRPSNGLRGPPWCVAAAGLAAAFLVACVALAWLRWSPFMPSAGFFGSDNSQQVGLKPPPPEFQKAARQEQTCCNDETAKCMACKLGWSVTELCAGHPEVDGCARQCCDEQRAECLACKAGTTVMKLCAEKTNLVAGCDRHVCCEEVTAECLACRDEMPIEKYCSKPENARVSGCEEESMPKSSEKRKAGRNSTRSARPGCCTRDSAQCQACQAGLSVGQFCLDKAHAKVSGCRAYCGLMEDNYVYPGGNLQTVHNVASAQECCARCREHLGCSSWSWGKTTGTTYYGKCYLKNQVEFIRRKDQAFISGLPGRNTMTFQIRNRHGHCLDWQPHLHLEACGGPSKESQQWYIDRQTGVIGTRHGLCIDSVEYLSPGGGIHLQPCTARVASQLWTFGITGLIRHFRGFCMDAPKYREIGSKVRIWPCQGDSESQLWSMWNTQVLRKPATIQAIQLEAMTTTTVTTTITSTSTFTTTTLKITPAMSLFCWSLMLPWGYEHTLLELQYKKMVSIFACDEFAVYSSSVINITGRKDHFVPTRVVNHDLHCKIGGAFGTALNTPVFIHVWKKVVDDGRYKYHSWTVKSDPDAVFFPMRLREIVGKQEYADAQVGNGVFFNNCNFGLHGPLEVLSRRSLDVYKLGWEMCRKPPQEDVYLQACLLKLGVKQVDQFQLLSEDHCKSKNWQRCQSYHCAFHPFKKADTYSGCLERAEHIDRTGGELSAELLTS